MDKTREQNIRNVRLGQEELTAVVKEWFAAGTEPFPLTVSGHSMTPFVAPDRDTVYLYPPDGKIKKGDVIFFVSCRGRLLLHRVKKVEGEHLVTIGDGSRRIDEGAELAEVIAVCGKIRRKGRIYGKNSLYWRFFSRVWINIVPLRPFILKLYQRIKSR